jgi:DNA ligase (NAD+)
MYDLFNTNLSNHDILESDPQKLITELTTKLIKCNEAYHANAISLISDEEYDRLFRELIELETAYPDYKRADSPTMQIGSKQLKSEFKQKPHQEPMLSLNNIFSFMDETNYELRHKELLQFDKRIRETLDKDAVEYIASPKYDGIAISLIYINGNLIEALTRGDGFVGEDVIDNIKTVKNIPKILKPSSLNVSIPSHLEVRGELLLFTEDFIALNKAQEKHGQKIFANPRNTVAGSVRQLDSSITATRPLHFFAYYVRSANNTLPTFYMQLDYLKNLGFDISELELKN